jgi:hypothetical protein
MHLSVSVEGDGSVLIGPCVCSMEEKRLAGYICLQWAPLTPFLLSLHRYIYIYTLTISLTLSCCA